VRDLYVDPPQLVTAGIELDLAGEQLSDLRAFADNDAVSGVRNSGAGNGNGLAAFEAAWERYTVALFLLSNIVSMAGVHTRAAARYYTETDETSAHMIANGRPVP
jgi:hypothetical protein